MTAPAIAIVLLAITPTGRPSIRANAVTSSGAKRSRRNVTEPSSASVSMIGSTVVGAALALRDQVAQPRLVGGRPRLGAAPRK